MKEPQGGLIKYDEVGEWSELKLEILEKYARAYSQILTSMKATYPKLRHSYIEGFAGAGHHVSKKTKELIPGSPMNALKVRPPFDKYHLVDLDESRVEELRRLTACQTNVTVYGGDCNKILG